MCNYDLNEYEIIMLVMLLEISENSLYVSGRDYTLFPFLSMFLKNGHRRQHLTLAFSSSSISSHLAMQDRNCAQLIHRHGSYQKLHHVLILVY